MSQKQKTLLPADSEFLKSQQKKQTNKQNPKNKKLNFWPLGT